MDEETHRPEPRHELVEGLAEGPFLHTVIPSQDLDGRATTGREVKSKSLHDMLQAFPNVSYDDLWGMLSNGIALRLLRDYHHTFSKGYVQFDLESIFETRKYSDFRASYRMCHACRFMLQGGGEEALLPLEQFYKDALDTGIRAQELCDIQIGDLDLGTNSIKIGGKGHGRDKKERHVFISKRTAKALWRYVTPRLSASGEQDRLFAVNIDDDPRPMSRDVLHARFRARPSAFIGPELATQPIQSADEGVQCINRCDDTG